MGKNRGLKEEMLYFILRIILVNISFPEIRELAAERMGTYLSCMH